MQAPPTERARFLHAVVGGLFLAGVLLGGTGCRDAAPPTAGYSPFGSVDTIGVTEAPRDSVLSLLTAIDRTAFDSAFAQLDAYAFTRQVRTEQLDSTGAVTAFRSLTVRYPVGAESGTVEQADSSGSFRQGGALAPITPARRRASKPANLAGQSLDDQPAYLAPRTREAYRYAVRMGSLRDGSPTYVIEAKAQSSGQGAEQGIRYARLTLLRDSQKLVGLRTIRASRILLFREHSQLTLRLQRAPEDPAVWVPESTHFRARVDVPFREPRQFRTSSTYSDYQHS